jgi:hypothetical protein
MRPKPVLFTKSELQTPSVLKSKLEWDQQDQERERIELQMLESGQPFTYEPYHYAWCAAYTPYDNQLNSAIKKTLSDGDQALPRELAKQSVARGWELIHNASDDKALQELMEHYNVTVNPVTGEVMPFYSLCARMNPDGQCPLFEEQTDPKSVSAP